MRKIKIIISLLIIVLYVNKESQAQDWGWTLIDNTTIHFDEYLAKVMEDTTNNNPGPAFISTCLRNHPSQPFSDIYAYLTEGPDTEDCEIQLRCALESRGFAGPFYDASELMIGDIVFTEDKVPYQDQYWPTHAFFFIDWVETGSTDFAYILDYHGPYVKRNITADGEYIKFQYFMRCPYNEAATGIANNHTTTNVLSYPNPTKNYVKFDFYSKQTAIVKITISDYLSRKITTDRFIAESDNKISKEINVSNLLPGIYFYFLEFEYPDKTKSFTSGKFCIE